MGFLAAFSYGSTIVFPSDTFNAQKVIDAVVSEKATALLGVPTMFIAELDVLEKSPVKINTIRTGLAAGSPVPKVLMEKLRKRMNIQGMLIAYGMTETSPVTFITSLDDSEEKMHNSIGRVFPHTGAKVIDIDGNIVPIGVRGEICTSGFALQKGYWEDEAKTQEVMKSDENGIRWMHTGDEGYIDEEGYGHITGRIKDIIIRGMSHQIWQGVNINSGQVARIFHQTTSRTVYSRTPTLPNPASLVLKITNMAKWSRAS
jgi:long-chain acyl-CoA synthetase